MKVTRKILGFMVLAAVVVASGSVGCKKKPKTAGGVGGMSDFGGVLGPMDGAGYGSLMNPDDLRAVASQFTPVYFEYDSSQIAGSERATLETIAQYLRSNPNVGLIAEGHCDERGSNEYNLALGERRAQAVRAYLIGLGIAADRIKTVSYGEERPAAFGHDESAWRQNRRVEFSLF
ncbi:MAG TPA: peptidoglycan-associated lipoprotein Pal [Kiritimatiellia bacterium]|nr:peptidoglycan-associated lipoprotein Pal [Kiritimatiellia bacterium]HMO98796.1 peptidoglycan-associated lipoprotein Pal [Kiritimatiellia bacterium]HMP96871.1 peptidoglycan-associated lipoprotein Pal [Kiritimatiellia bacterium]